MTLDLTFQQAQTIVDALTREYVHACESDAPESRKKEYVSHIFYLRRAIAMKLMQAGAITIETYQHLYS